MVLHMRKLISVLIALIMMMSAAPVFAEEVFENESAETVKVVETTEPATPAEKEAVVSENIDDGDKTTGKNTKDNEETWVELSIYDSDEYLLEDKVKVQIHEGMTISEMLNDFNEDEHYDFNWEKCVYIINDSEKENIDIKTFELKSEDEIVIRVNKEEEELAPLEESFDSEDLQVTAVAPETLESAYSTTGTKVTQTAAGSKWEFGSEWIVMGLSRSDSMSDADAKTYCDRVAAYVNSRKSEKLNDSLSTDNSRLIISLTSLGYDPTDVNGYNLLQPLSDMNYLTKQGLSGPVWALIAFDSHDYEIPKAGANQKQTTREGLINLLVGSQVNGQGWDMSGKSPDVDMTCMVLQALTPYYNDDNPNVKTVVDNALNWLSSIQKDDGSFCTDTASGTSSESQSQVIVALTGLGIDPEKDARFVKGNNSAMDALMSFYVSGGGFKHVSANWKANGLATQQGYYALAAYYRFKNGSTSLYDMSDMILKKFIGVVRDGDTGSSTKKIETKGKALGHTRSLGYLALGNDEDIDKDLIKENFGNGQDNGSALAQQKAYNEYIKSVKMAKTLPWIYMCIGALALMGLVLMLRNRKPE